MTLVTTVSPRDRSAKRAPAWFVLSAWIVPVVILAQFLVAGLSLFQNASFWEWHMSLGFLLSLPIGAMAVAAALPGPVRALRWWTGLFAMLYILQIVLITVGQNSGSGVLQALHPFNGALMLVTAIVILGKVQRSHGG